MLASKLPSPRVPATLPRTDRATFKLTQETITIGTVDLTLATLVPTLAGFVISSTNDLRDEACADREAWQAQDILYPLVALPRSHLPAPPPHRLRTLPRRGLKFRIKRIRIRQAG